ncbi:MAG: glycosyltransferase family 4 protein [Candidatus Heimdallarchaeota archaeon]
MAKILLLANASSALLRCWVRLGDKKHQIHLVSIKAKDPSLGNVIFRRVHVKESTIRSYLKLLFTIKKIVKEVKPDIIISHYTTNYGMIANHSGFHPHIAVVYGSDVFRKGFFLKLINRRVLRNADKIFVSAEHTRNFLHENYPLAKSKILTKSWGINTKLFTPEIRESRNFKTKILDELNLEPAGKYLLSPRLIGSVYNHEQILDAFALISRDYPEYKLIMMHYNIAAAADKYYNQLKEKVRQLQLTDKIVWSGRYLSSEEMADLYSLAEVIINVPKYDQLASTLLEGLSCGCFSIVSNLPPYYEVVRDGWNGFILPVITSKSIYKAFVKFVQKKNEYQHNALIGGKEILEKYREEYFISYIKDEVDLLVRTVKTRIK